ncbi:MAG: hypothetical protein QOI41_2268, partial [Myxococcales bacterium]|nr:hypothetical protein [Myxococcales bacterium]
MTIDGLDMDRASRRSESTDDDLPTPQRETLRETPAARLAAHVERQPTSTEYRAFLSNVANVANVANVLDDARRDAAIQRKLDAVRDAFSGPYVVAGEAVSARPMFRMTTHAVPAAMARAVDTLGARAGVRAPFEARVGQCRPQDLVKITQALIDDGRLPAGPGDLAMRIRRMQWDHGIGVDCAGYSKQALAAVSTRAPKMYAAGSESFRDVDGGRDGSFAKVSLANARPGDLITLDASEPGGWGHNVVVYSHATADTAKKAMLCGTTRNADLVDFLSSPGPHHVFEVDSSWGAGIEGAECGGYRRDTWLYDASTKTWGSFEPG